MKDTIIQIKKELRANMNGIASDAMGRKSEDYRVNFGVEIPRLHNIASEFEASNELAQQLWKESVRECRILATILQPVDSFLPEIADIWVDDIRTLELAQVASLNLFSRLPYASDKVFQWIASEREITQQCGYLTLCHIMRKGEMNERSADEFIDQALTAYAGGSMMLQRTLMRAFAIFAENNPSAAKRLPKEFL
jgi:3-methyladenine DNA glycosylase AlkD